MTTEHAPHSTKPIRSPEAEVGVAPNLKLILPLGNLSLLDVEVQRGDRQLPDEPNRGFVIERLKKKNFNRQLL